MLSAYQTVEYLPLAIESVKAESFSKASFFKTLSSKVLERFSPFFPQKSVSNGQFCPILWSKSYYRPCWVYKHQKNPKILSKLMKIKSWKMRLLKKIQLYPLKYKWCKLYQILFTLIIIFSNNFLLTKMWQNKM